jgi:predicted nucleic acid-binding protein
VILVDTSIWIDHLRSRDETLAERLNRREILIHPYVIGELALGHMDPRAEILTVLQDIPQVATATESEVLHLIESTVLFGTGIGYIDAHLLAAVKLRPGTRLWTRDKRLSAVAARLDLAATVLN